MMRIKLFGLFIAFALLALVRPRKCLELLEAADDSVDAMKALAREQRDAQGLASLLRRERQRFEFLHSSNTDADGWEWGVARVRLAESGRVEYLWGLSDHSDIDAAMSTQECALPPPGWRCTRAAGHDGPCAAVATHMPGPMQ